MRDNAPRPSLAILSVLMLLLVAITAVPPTPAEAKGAKRFDATERLAFRLVNCLRTGGKVTAAGKCIGYGSGRFSKKVPALKFSRKISNQVSWPWAKRTVAKRGCTHSMTGSTVDRRFRAAGLRNAKNGENIGCATYDPRRMTIFIVRWWQRERSYRGAHWRQIKDRRFKSAGFGVAKHGRRAHLVVNFYGKAVK